MGINKALLTFIFLFVVKSLLAQQTIQKDYKNAREPGNEIFIITRDSVKHPGAKMKVAYNNPILKRDKLKLDKTNIKMYTILAFQDESAFTRLVDEKRGIFAHRIRRGKINLFLNIAIDFNATHIRWAHFYVEKDPGKVLWLTYSLLEEMIADDTAAVNLLKMYFPAAALPAFRLEKEHYMNILKVFDQYNGNL